MRNILIIIISLLLVGCGTSKRYLKTNTTNRDTTIVNYIDTTKVEIKKDSLTHTITQDNSTIEETIVEQIKETKPDSTIIETKREIKRTIIKDVVRVDTTEVQSLKKLNTHIQKDSTTISKTDTITTDKNLKKNGFNQALLPIILILSLLVIILVMAQKWF